MSCQWTAVACSCLLSPVSCLLICDIVGAHAPSRSSRSPFSCWRSRPAQPSASAQDTRTAALEQQRAEKAKQLQPYQPGRIEKLLLYIERVDPLAKISPHDGFFIRYGYTGKPLGAGVGLSAGYRHDLFNRNARVLVEAGASMRKYRMLRGDFSLPYLARDRFEVGFEATYRHDPQEDFYGLGPDSLESNRVNFLYDRTEFQGRAIFKPVPGVQVGARFGRINPELGPGQRFAVSVDRGAIWRRRCAGSGRAAGLLPCRAVRHRRPPR